MANVLNRTDLVEASRVVQDPARLKVPSNLRGRTSNFAVYVDPLLGTDGKRDADDVLARCEADYATVSSYFNGLSAGPFRVVLFSNPNGAYHLTCSATNLFCDARVNPADGNYAEFLNVAEVVEVFEVMQSMGWACGMSNGEGLSRVLAADAYPNELQGFATASSWLDSGRPDYVDRNSPTDTDPVANGCSVLFLNWLRFQLKYSWQQIVTAAEPTLGRTYSKLTGQDDGFKQFNALMTAQFPIGLPVQLENDNPFPI